MLSMDDKIALFHARSLKNFCTGYKDMCWKPSGTCPFYNEKTDMCILGCPYTWPDEMISKEREE